LYACVGRTCHSDKAESFEAEIAILFVQRCGDAFASTGSAVVNGDVDAFGDGKRAGISVLFAKRLAHHLHLIGKLCGGLRAGAEETIRISHGSAKSVWVTAAEPDWRVRFLKRLWLHRSRTKMPKTTPAGP